jgi:hypothetical protein
MLLVDGGPDVGGLLPRDIGATESGLLRASGETSTGHGDGHAEPVNKNETAGS